jgi:hypothetical protein
VAVYKTNSLSPIETYTVKAGNTFSVKILSQKLSSGKYSVKLELLLDQINSNVAKNPTNSFWLEVIPVTAEIKYQGAVLTDYEKKLTEHLQNGLNTNQVPIIISAPPKGTQNRYDFVVKINEIKSSSSYGADLVNYSVTLSFLRNGKVIKQSVPKDFKSVAKNYTFDKEIGPFISNNEQFFSGVKEELE